MKWSRLYSLHTYVSDNGKFQIRKCRGIWEIYTGYPTFNQYLGYKNTLKEAKAFAENL